LPLSCRRGTSVDTPFREGCGGLRAFAGDLAEGSEAIPANACSRRSTTIWRAAILKADWRQRHEAPAETLSMRWRCFAASNGREASASRKRKAAERVNTLLALLEMASASSGSEHGELMALEPRSQASRDSRLSAHKRDLRGATISASRIGELSGSGLSIRDGIPIMLVNEARRFSDEERAPK